MTDGSGNTADSKFGGNTLDIVFSMMTANEVQQMMTMNVGSLQLTNENKNLTAVSEGLGGLGTNTSGAFGGALVGISLAVGIAVVGLGVSCILGPEAEVAADALDVALMGGDMAGDAAVDVTVDTTKKVTEDVVTTVFKDEDGNTLKKITEKVDTKTDGSIENQFEVKEGHKTTRYTDTTDKDGNRKITEKTSYKTPFVFDVSKPSGKLSKKVLGLTAGAVVMGGIGGGMAADKTISSGKTNKFNQQYSYLNNLAEIINNTIGQVNSQLISAPNQMIQTDQSVISTALQTSAGLNTIPPVQ